MPVRATWPPPWLAPPAEAPESTPEPATRDDPPAGPRFPENGKATGTGPASAPAPRSRPQPAAGRRGPARDDDTPGVIGPGHRWGPTDPAAAPAARAEPDARAERGAMQAAVRDAGAEDDRAVAVDWSGVTAADLAGAPPPPPRPADPPAYGLTVRGHVVELARRTAAAERSDPLKLVTGAGWPAWYPALNPGPRRPPAAGTDNAPAEAASCRPVAALADASTKTASNAPQAVTEAPTRAAPPVPVLSPIRHP